MNFATIFFEAVMVALSVIFRRPGSFGDPYNDYDLMDYRESQELAYLDRDRLILRISAIFRAVVNDHYPRKGESISREKMAGLASDVLDHLLRQTGGNSLELNLLLQQAERSSDGRKRWFVQSVAPQHKRILELMAKVAA